MVRPCPGGARLSALGFCITLFAFSVFWQRRLARVMGHGIPYQKHRCLFHLFFICCGLLSEFCGCWLILGHWLGHQRTPIISFQMPGSLTSLTTEAQTSRIPVWKMWKQSLHLSGSEEETTLTTLHKVFLQRINPTSSFPWNSLLLQRLLSLTCHCHSWRDGT